MYKLREVERGRYDDRGYSNEQSLAALMLQKPEEINNFLTYTYGMNDDRFPLTFLTEGQGAAGVRDISTVEWTWKTMGRMKTNDYVVWFNMADTTPGIGGKTIEVEFATGLFIEQFGLMSPDGTTVRIMRDLGPGTHGGHKYALRIKNPDKSAYVDPENFEKGKYWCMLSPSIPESYSKGNKSNVMGPGMMKSQLGFKRYTKEIAGNISNVIVNYAFKTRGGGTDTRWINEEMRQFDVQMRISNEIDIWTSKYNRTPNGTIDMKDWDNDQPIPETAGMFEILEESNYDTYGEYLPLSKLKRTVGDVLDKDTDTGAMQITLFAGRGGLEDFDESMRGEAKSEGFITPLGDKMIGEEGGGLTYGKYFRKYKTIDGHTITAVHLPFLDKSPIAELDRANGNIHPRTGLPMCSHQLMFIDNSTYNGERNIRMVRMKGQSYLVGVLKGLTPIPPSWGAVPDRAIATEIDKSTYEVKMSRGLQVNRAEKMFILRCSL